MNFIQHETPGTAGADRASQPWPSLKEYDEAHLDRISLPIGGIGTGTVGLGGRGDLRDFQLGNRPSKGFRPQTALFAIRTQAGTDEPQARVLEGPLGSADFEGGSGAPSANHGLPRFRAARFDTAYPFGRVSLRDPQMPDVDIEGFNPLIPGDIDASSLPAAIIRFVVTNTTRSWMNVTVVGAIENFIGGNGTESATGGNINTVASSNNLHGIRMTAPELDPGAEAAGAFVLAVIGADDESTITTRTGWADASWGNSLLDFWDDLLDDGKLEPRNSRAERPIGSVASLVKIASGESHSFTFMMTWVFPNRRAWRSEDHKLDQGEYTETVVGNHYAVLYPDPWEAAITVANDLHELESRTRAAVTSIIRSTVPVAVREAALFNISTLRSPTVFRTADGRFYGWEGVMDHVGSCFGTCTHVWGYEFATSFWFSELAWSFRETQYELMTGNDGMMSFRAGLPIEDSKKWRLAAADGQMACLVHLYHDWRLSGDDDRLRRLWPAARRSLEFAWISGGWDADKDGVMEGCQHNTMDVEYYGPNPQMGTWYLAALKACSELADHLGEHDFAAECRSLFVHGSAWIDENLFTGEYYRHEIRPVGEGGYIAPGLRHSSMGARDLNNPESQLGDGVLIDQLVGQYAARLTGLGNVLDPGHVRKALDTIYARNFTKDLSTHFNHMRSYALQDEAGVLMCTYEAGKRPKRPFPYFNEIMTGFEYTAAVGLLQDGDRAKGIEIIEAIRARYNGLRRNPFNEAECGHHYARAMASWSAFVAWNGFSYSAPTGEFKIEMTESEGSTFWSTGSAFGTWKQSTADGTVRGLLLVTEGTVNVSRIVFGDSTVEVVNPGPVRGGESITVIATG